MTPQEKRQNKKWFRAAIGLPVAVVLALVAADVLELWFGLIVLLASAPAWVLIWSRLIAADVVREPRTRSSNARVSLLTPYAQSILDILPDAIVLVDSDLKVEEANNAARDLFRVRLMGRDFSQILRHPGAVDAMELALETGTAQTAEVSLLSPVARDFELIALPMKPDAYGSKEPSDGPEDPRHAMTIALHEVTALKRAEQLRADFVANASHELRTPLASLIGFIETLQGPAQDDSEARDRFLSIMGEESARMARLIDDLLSLSRIELDEHLSPSEAVDIAHVVEASAESLILKATQRNMKVDVDLGTAPPDVIGDTDQLTQVFQNLIDNAIKYGREGTDVTVRTEHVERLATTGGPALSLTVHNEGDAIDREHLPRLTDRFYRVDAARSRAMGGTGLGLAIVKHIINRHRGHLAFSSAPGIGTDVTVSIPLAIPEEGLKTPSEQGPSGP